MPLRTDAFTADTAPGPALKQTSEKNPEKPVSPLPRDGLGESRGKNGTVPNPQNSRTQREILSFCCHFYFHSQNTHTHKKKKKLPRGLPPAAHKGELYFSNTASPYDSTHKNETSTQKPQRKENRAHFGCFFLSNGTR